MFRVITDVSAMVRNLKTFELIDKKSLVLRVQFPEGFAYKITVRFKTCMKNAKLCCQMLESLREKGHTVKLISTTASRSRTVTIEYEFFEKNEQ